MVRIAYILLLIAAAAFFPLYEDKLSCITLITMLTLPVLMLIQGMISAFRMKLSTKNDRAGDVIFLDSEGEVCLSLTNRSPFPLSNTGVKVRITYLPTNAVKYVMADVPVPAHSTQTISVNIEAEHCGMAEVSLEYVKAHDVMGLFSFKRFRKYGSCGKVYIIPRVSEEYADEAAAMLSRSYELADIESENTRERGNGAPGDVNGFREFAPGDKLSHMHYKLSARFDKDIVKVFSVQNSSRYLLSADLSVVWKDNEPQLAARDRILERLLSCAHFLSENKAEVYAAVPENTAGDVIKLAGGAAIRYTDIDSLEAIARAVAGADFVGTRSGQGYICCPIETESDDSDMTA